MDKDPINSDDDTETTAPEDKRTKTLRDISYQELLEESLKSCDQLEESPFKSPSKAERHSKTRISQNFIKIANSIVSALLVLAISFFISISAIRIFNGTETVAKALVPIQAQIELLQGMSNQPKLGSSIERFVTSLTGPNLKDSEVSSAVNTLAQDMMSQGFSLEQYPSIPLETRSNYTYWEAK